MLLNRSPVSVCPSFFLFLALSASLIKVFSKQAINREMPLCKVIHVSWIFFCLADSFTLKWLKEPSKPVIVNLTFKDIAWKSDREVKFKNPPGDLKVAFRDYAKPPNWPRPVYELDVNDSDNNGFQNQDFIVWMRTAAFSKFRKLYRKVIHKEDFETGLPKGEYRLDIKYSILSCYY